MQPILLFLSFIIANSVFAQNIELDRYYLVDTIKQKNKVKTSTYTNASFPHLNSVYEYDTLGRQILWYYTNEDTKHFTKYLSHKDTIIEVEYGTKYGIEKSTRQITKYVYNKKGFISFYASCRESSVGKKTEADFVQFYYDKSNKLNSVLYYSTYNYPFAVNVHFPVIDTLFNLTNVESFYYNNIAQLIAKKQMIGNKDERYADSFFYDKKKRLIKEVRFQKEGFVGEMRHGNIFLINQYAYSDSSAIQTTITQFDNAFGKTNAYVERQYETVRNKKGLVDKTFSIKDKIKTLSGTNEYSYYN